LAVTNPSPAHLLLLLSFPPFSFPQFSSLILCNPNSVPGIPATNKKVRVPFTSVVNIRGDRLYHEHIAWDQASVLRQLGLLPEYLPFPYPLPDGRVPGKGKRFEYR
jgi:hypothetical protein